jgi:Cof subfamily protein (haloacid dehalogenase superfamily)
MDSRLPLSHSSSIELVALDLDGTLMGGDLQISSRVRDVVKSVQCLGITVTLATGRMFSTTLPFADLLGINAPLICYQGGWIQAPGGDVLQRKVLSQAIAQNAVVLGDVQNWHTVLYADGVITIKEKQYPDAFYQYLLGSNIVLNQDLGAVLDVKTADKVLYVAEPEEIPMMAEILAAHFTGKAEIVQSHRMLIEIVPIDVNKGWALAWLASHLGIQQSAVLAIGDQENDVPMLSWAGLGIAMGNAVPAARHSADWVAPTLEDDGAAVALECFVLKGSSL